MTMYKGATWNGRSFWHGTSSIFLQSIRNTGLGAINPSTDLKLLGVLQFLYAETRTQNISHPVLDINRASIEAIITQNDLHYNGQLLNYRHEGAYISASAMRASYYACLNHVGSEILEKCMILLCILIDAGKEPSIPSELNVFDIRRFLEERATPVMIEIIDVPDEYLVLENGDDAKAMLKEMREAFPKLSVPQQFERLQFCNFRLLRPIETTALRFYEVMFHGHPNDRDFDFYLTRI